MELEQRSLVEHYGYNMGRFIYSYYKAADLTRQTTSQEFKK